MIAALLLAVAPVKAPEPPPVTVLVPRPPEAEQSPLARSRAAKGPLDLEIPDTIADLHNAYVLCQDRHFDARRVRDRAGFRNETERAISACAAEKAALKQAAEARLAGTSGYAEPERRGAAIAEAFDGYDRVRRAMAGGVGPAG